MSKSVYEMVTDRIIEQLENNIIPWEKPWTGIRSGAFNSESRQEIVFAIVPHTFRIGYQCCEMM